MTTSSRADAMAEISLRFTQRYGSKNRELIDERVKELSKKRKLNTSDITKVENKIKKQLGMRAHKRRPSNNLVS